MTKSATLSARRLLPRASWQQLVFGRGWFVCMQSLFVFVFRLGIFVKKKATKENAAR
jgi:hypothetical protein